MTNTTRTCSVATPADAVANALPARPVPLPIGGSLQMAPLQPHRPRTCSGYDPSTMVAGRRAVLGGLAAVILLLVACAEPASAPRPSESALPPGEAPFLQQLRAPDDTRRGVPPALPDQRLIDVGYAVCAKFDRGHSTGAIVAGLRDFTQDAYGELDPAVLEPLYLRITGAAVEHLCPEHEVPFQTGRERMQGPSVPETPAPFEPDDFPNG